MADSVVLRQLTEWLYMYIYIYIVEGNTFIYIYIVEGNTFMFNSLQ